MTRLHEACAVGDPDLVRKALSAGGDPNSQDFDSRFTPLHCCVAAYGESTDRQEVIRLLEAAGADFEIADGEKGLTPLLYAAIRNKPLCASALIECGADVNVVEVNGATPLHGAAFQGNLEVARALLKAGANPQLKDRGGMTPAMVARAQGHSALVDILDKQ